MKISAHHALLAWLLGCSGALLPELGAAAEQTPSIALYYNQRIPYTYSDNGIIKGNLAETTERVFHQAGILFSWAKLPIARQFAVLQDNAEPLCLVGRFKTADRESLGRFTLPIYRDLPQGLLVRRDNARVQSFTSLEAAITSPELRLVVKNSYSYGATIDAWLKKRAVPAKDTFDENYNMLRQLQHGLADALIIAEDESTGLLSQSEANEDDFVLMKFKDAPPGELRYLLCSHKVSPQTIERLNAAIRAVKR